MDKKKLHYIHKQLSVLKPWYLLIAGILFLLLAIYGLRQNNLTMIRLRDAVVQADQKNGDVEKALQELRAHVHGHMNTDLSSGQFAIKPPIQLKARYDRLMAQEQEKVRTQNEAVTKQGETVCAQRFPGDGFNAPRVSCIQEYVAANAAKPKDIPEELYKFDFISPKWSPDLAGVSLVLAFLSFLLFGARYGLERWFRSKDI